MFMYFESMLYFNVVKLTLGIIVGIKCTLLGLYVLLTLKPNPHRLFNSVIIDVFLRSSF